MRLRLALIASLLAAPAMAQQNAGGEGLANRIAAATDALSRYRVFNDGVWASASGASIDDRRTGLSRKVTVRALQFGYDHNFLSPFTPYDALLVGVAGSVLNASSRADAQNLQIDSKGYSVTGYGVYAPYVFLSFPVSVTVTRWSSDQTRDGTPLQPVYSTNYKSTSWSSSVGAALTLPVWRFLMTTTLAHRYSDNKRPDYSEAINPLATDFVTTPSEITQSSQLAGTFRLTLPTETGRVWVLAGYTYDIKRSPAEDTRSEFPLGLGADLITRRWLVGVSGQAILREDITSYSGSFTGRLQF